jgi:hypothetical protein
MARDGSVWRRSQTDHNQIWSDWSYLGIPGGNGLARSLALGQNRDGRLEVFAVRQDGSAWHRWQRTAGSEGEWSEWRSLGLPHGRVLGSLVVINSFGRLEAFALATATGGEPAMWHRWQTVADGSWSEWFSLGAPGSGRPGEPVLGANVDGRLVLFTVASDGCG